jgi:coenzyme F420-reducing hydrogenase alpha subunit
VKGTGTITVRHVARVEGHGNIRIRVRDGRLREARWEIVETPRFFEAMLRGKRYDVAPWIAGRICGICSAGHTLASIRAAENAFGFSPSAQTRDLRILLKHAETLQSHVLHLYFLSAPDFLGAGSVFPLIGSHPEVVRRGARLKQLGNELMDLVGGRRMHPTRAVVGGFTMLPEKRDLDRFRERLAAALPDLSATADLFRSFPIPDFARETEFVSLRGDGAYPFIGGDILSSDGVVRPEVAYREMTNEYEAPHSTAKWCRLTREAFAVGPLARVNNNFRYLRPEARELAESLGLSPVRHNPFLSHAARLAECLHVALESVSVIDALLASSFSEPRAKVPPRAGRGTAAVEVPRGILYHSYEFDPEGRIVSADCVIPTGQNHGNIRMDLEELARRCVAEGRTDGEIERLAEMLVRSYDPCISCSVH